MTEPLTDAELAHFADTLNDSGDDDALRVRVVAELRAYRASYKYDSTECEQCGCQRQSHRDDGVGACTACDCSKFKEPT